MRYLSILVFTYSFLAHATGEEEFLRFELAAKAIRRRADIECVGRLITKSPDSEAILTAKKISADKRNWSATIATIQAQASEVEPGQTFTVVDADGALNQEQWTHLLKLLGLRILGIRRFDESGKIRALVQKVDEKQGVELQLVDVTHVTSPRKFEIQYFKNHRSGELREMIARRERRIFTFPYYFAMGKLFVVARPESHGIPMTVPLADVGGTGYLPQPVAIPLANRERPVRKAVQLLREMFPYQLGFWIDKATTFFYPSPDSVMEGVTELYVELKRPLREAVFDWEGIEAGPLLQRLNETTDGDGVFETSLYFLFRVAERPLPPWSGEALSFTDSPLVAPPAPDLGGTRVKGWRRRTWFPPAKPNFWIPSQADYREVDSGGLIKTREVAEFATKVRENPHLISFLPVKKISGRIWIGLMQIDSPASQIRGESSRLWSLPVLRTRFGEISLSEGLKSLSFQLERQLSVEIQSLQSLGASFRNERELSTDLIHPFVAEIKGDVGNSRLAWYPLDELVTKELDKFTDARLILCLFRLAHAEGLLPIE